MKWDEGFQRRDLSFKQEYNEFREEDPFILVIVKHDVFSF